MTEKNRVKNKIIEDHDLRMCEIKRQSLYSVFCYSLQLFILFRNVAFMHYNAFLLYDINQIKKYLHWSVVAIVFNSLYSNHNIMTIKCYNIMNSSFFFARHMFYFVVSYNTNNNSIFIK